MVFWLADRAKGFTKTFPISYLSYFRSLFHPFKRKVSRKGEKAPLTSTEVPVLEDIQPVCPFTLHSEQCKQYALPVFHFTFLGASSCWHCHGVISASGTFSAASPDKSILCTRCASFSSAVMDAIFNQSWALSFHSRDVASAPLILLCFHLFKKKKTHFRKFPKTPLANFNAISSSHLSRTGQRMWPLDILLKVSVWFEENNLNCSDSK